MNAEPSHTNQSGFSLIEVVLAIFVFIATISTFTTTYLYGLEAARTSGERVRATMLAEEAIAAVYSMRDANFSSLADGTHGLGTANNKWALSGSSDEHDVFTRTIAISTVDSYRKDVTITITWEKKPGVTSTITFVTQIGKWFSKSWGNPDQESSLDLSGNSDGKKIQVAGNYAYIIRDDNDPDFVVVDISDTSAPTQVGSLALDGDPNDVFVSGDYAYVASSDDSEELQIVSISTPSSPSLAGSLNIPGNQDASGVYVVGSKAYITSWGDHEFTVVDVSTVSSPSIDGSINLSDDVNEVVVTGDYAYLASDNSEELHIIDISTPSSPTNIGGLDLPTNLDGISVAVLDDTIFLAQNNLIRSIDITNRTSPSLSDSLDLGNTITDIALEFGINDTRMYVSTTDNSAELQVVDITDPSDISLLGTLDISSDDDQQGVAYSDTLDRAFVVGVSDGQELTIVEPN